MWGQVYWNSPTQEMICGYGHEQKLKYPCSRDSKIIQMPYPWAKAIDQIAALCPASPLPAGLPPYRYITAEATWSHWLSIFVSTAIDSVNVVISLECFEHELTWLAFKNITRGSTLSEKDRHLCMPDERIRRDTCQSFLPKTPNPVRSERCRVLVPSFCGLRMEFLGPWPPFWRGNLLHFLTRAFRIRKPE